MTCTNNITVRNAFYKLGRTDKRSFVTNPGYANYLGISGYANPRARYALHFHECGTDTNEIPGVVSGCVARDNPGWAFVNHESFVNFTNNVAFDFDGAGFAIENGDEGGSFIKKPGHWRHGRRRVFLPAHYLWQQQPHQFRRRRLSR